MHAQHLAHGSDKQKRLPSPQIGAWISMVVYALFAAGKLTIGFLGNSHALWADGINNVSDLFVSMTVLIGLRMANKPPDPDHPYGHERMETIASLLASFVIGMAGLQVLQRAIAQWMRGVAPTPDLLTVYVGIASSVVLWGVYRYNAHLARITQRRALLAVAMDTRSDAFVSAGTCIGIGGAIYGIGWLDAATASLIGVVILWTAWKIFREATWALSDGFEPLHLSTYTTTIKAVKGVLAVQDVRGRLHGNVPILDVTICVDPLLTVSESHRISEHIEHVMYAQHQLLRVHIHIEPLASD